MDRVPEDLIEHREVRGRRVERPVPRQRERAEQDGGEDGGRQRDAAFGSRVEDQCLARGVRDALEERDLAA
jgi:hypothetical protein